MKKQISIILCLLLLFWLLPVKADAAPTGTPEQVVGEDARIVIDAPGNQTLLPGQKNVGWSMAAMVGLV